LKLLPKPWLVVLVLVVLVVELLPGALQREGKGSRRRGVRNPVLAEAPLPLG